MSIEDNAVAIFTAFSKTQHLDAEKLAVAPENAISIQDYYIALLRPTWGMDAGYASLAMEQKGLIVPATDGNSAGEHVHRNPRSDFPGFWV